MSALKIPGIATDGGGIISAPRTAYPTTPNTLFINSTTDALSVSRPFAVVGGVWSDSNYWYDSASWSDT